jgi:hypothetical protein
MRIQTIKKPVFVGFFLIVSMHESQLGTRRNVFSSSLVWLVEKLRASDTFTCGNRSSGR